jgi:Holliday junction resolvasome RuvABC endonuclease subunit
MGLIVGIDPDLRKSGVCTLNALGQICALDSLTIVELMKLVSDMPDALYAIEDVNKVKAIYQRNIRAKNAVGLKIAQSVGMVKATATLIAELIEYETGRKVILAPTGLGKQFKNDAKLFKEVTGYQGSTNEDKRDAYAIAHWVFKNRGRLTK